MKLYEPIAINELGQRNNQEDCVSPPAGNADAADRTFLVCDGMGGHEAGEVASGAVCEAVSEYMREHSGEPFGLPLLKGAIEAGYDLLEQRDTTSGQKRMGTTLTFLHLSDTMAYMAHIGDSRIYHLRPGAAGGARIVYKSSDHSLVNELVRAGVITPEEAVGHPQKNVITRAMQARDDRRDGATVHVTNDVADGDMFFLCSDGVLESVSDESLCELCGDLSMDDAQRVSRIAELCKVTSRDNFSAYFIHVEEGIASGSIHDETCELGIDMPHAAGVFTAIALDPDLSAASRENNAADLPSDKANSTIRNSGRRLSMIAVGIVAVVAGVLFGIFSMRSDGSGATANMRTESKGKISAPTEMNAAPADVQDVPVPVGAQPPSRKIQKPASSSQAASIRVAGDQTDGSGQTSVSAEDADRNSAEAVVKSADGGIKNSSSAEDASDKKTQKNTINNNI